MRTAGLVLGLALALASGAAEARGKPARRPPAPARAVPEARPDARPAPPAEAKPGKAKVYTFTGLDVEGKLKTPQLLYFFDRVKLELDTTTQQKRSFMKELEASSSDKGL